MYRKTTISQKTWSFFWYAQILFNSNSVQNLTGLNLNDLSYFNAKSLNTIMWFCLFIYCNYLGYATSVSEEVHSMHDIASLGLFVVLFSWKNLQNFIGEKTNRSNNIYATNTYVCNDMNI